MKVGVTGGDGFIGWHLRARLLLEGLEPVNANRATFEDAVELDRFVAGCDAIVHAAGVNRSSSADDIRTGNIAAAQTLADALDRRSASTPLIYLNSIHSTVDGPYGESKAAAASLLEHRQHRAGAPFCDLVLPHVFGEYGRPHYNSVVATFAH